MAVVSGALAVLSAASLVTPATLITITLLLGICQALTSPGWQAIQPELVPRAQLPAAAALGSLNVNVARAIGPALAGLVLAVSSPAVVFGIDAISDLAVVGAVLAWKRQANAPAAAEPMAPALRPGCATSATHPASAGSWCAPHCSSCPHQPSGVCSPS